MPEARLIVVTHGFTFAQQLDHAQENLGKIDKPRFLAGFFVGPVYPHLLAQLTIFDVAKLLRTSAFLLLGIDKPLQATWRPVGLIELQIF